jgi:DNA-binding NarL/FixJ family response regulator
MDTALATTSRKSSSKPVIFAVSGDEDMADFYRAALEHCVKPEPEVHCFLRAEIAWRAIETARRQPDLLVSHYLLHSNKDSSMTGLELIRRCRKAAPKLKTVLVSGLDLKEIKQILEVSDTQPDAFLHVPFDPEHLASLVEPLLPGDARSAGKITQ